MNDDLLILCAAVTGAIAAVTGVVNAFLFSRLSGRVKELSKHLRTHTSTPGLHR